MCQDLLKHIVSETEKCIKTAHNYPIKDIKLANFGIHLNQVQKRSKNTEIQKHKQFDLDKYMARNKTQSHHNHEDNDDNPAILLLSIQRFHCNKKTGDYYLNSQEVKFSDTLSVPATDGTQQLQYILTGYILFVGDHEKGHYIVICRGKKYGQNDRWFRYNDETTNHLGYHERDNYIHKLQVVLLLYAEQSYCKGTMEFIGAIKL